MSKTVTGYRVSRDGVDASGNGPYTQLLGPEARSFTMTNLVPGVTYRVTVEVLFSDGTVAATTRSVTTALAPAADYPSDPATAPGVQKTGDNYLLAQNVPGDLHTKLSKSGGRILSLEGKLYRESDFDHAYGSTSGRGYWAAATVPSSCEGIVGTDPSSTVIEIVPSSSTKTKSANPYGLSDSSYTNDIYMLMAMSNSTNFLLQDLTFRGTPQHPTDGNKMQGHDYNGVAISRPGGNVTVRNVVIANTPGSGPAPPAETFMLNFYNQPVGRKVLFENLKILGGKVGSAGLGINRVQGAVDINTLKAENTRYSAGIALWQVGPDSVVNIRNSVMQGCRRHVGAEAIAGTVNIYDPLWTDPQTTRFDINFTWAKTGTTIWKNGRINFYFSSNTAWTNFQAKRVQYKKIRVVTNTRIDYGSGPLPLGSYEDPWKKVFVYVKDAGGTYVQKPVTDYVDFFGDHR